MKFFNLMGDLRTMDDVQRAMCAALGQLIEGKRGLQKQLAHAVGVDPSYINKLAHAEKGGSPGIWEKIAAELGYSYSDFMSLGRRILGDDALPESKEDSFVLSGMVRIPVFRAGAGPNKFWTDGQRQPGDADQFVVVPAHDVDENTFGVICKGESMSPTCDDGDIAIVVPSEEPAHGKVCFATWPEDDGARMVRRFYKYGDSVVLRPDNPQAGEEITLDDSNGHGVRIYRVVAIYKKRP